MRKCKDTTKVGIVFDDGAKSKKIKSLNNCLEVSKNYIFNTSYFIYLLFTVAMFLVFSY